MKRNQVPKLPGSTLTTTNCNQHFWKGRKQLFFEPKIVEEKCTPETGKENTVLSKT